MRFWYYWLAEKLGYISVSKMLGEVTSKEISEWQAYYMIKDEQLKINEKASKAREKAKKQGR